jgi:hypothetical protein
MKKKLVAHLAREQEKKRAKKKKRKKKRRKGFKCTNKRQHSKVQNAQWGRDLSVV